MLLAMDLGLHNCFKVSVVTTSKLEHTGEGERLALKTHKLVVHILFFLVSLAFASCLH